MHKIIEKIRRHIHEWTRPRYRDSAAVSAVIDATVLPSDFANKEAKLPEFTASAEVLQPFEPSVFLLTTCVTATYAGVTEDRRVRAELPDCEDLVILEIIYDGQQVLPVPVTASTLTRHGMLIPRRKVQSQFGIKVAVADSILTVLKPPVGFTQEDLRSVDVKARFTIVGPQ